MTRDFKDFSAADGQATVQSLESHAGEWDTFMKSLQASTAKQVRNFGALKIAGVALLAGGIAFGGLPLAIAGGLTGVVMYGFGIAKQGAMSFVHDSVRTVAEKLTTQNDTKFSKALQTVFEKNKGISQQDPRFAGFVLQEQIRIAIKDTGSENKGGLKQKLIESINPFKFKP